MGSKLLLVVVKARAGATPVRSGASRAAGRMVTRLRERLGDARGAAWLPSDTSQTSLMSISSDIW